MNRRPHPSLLTPPFALLFAALLGAGVACDGVEEAEPTSDSLYATIQGVDGVYFYPPLGPEPTPQGAFDAMLLDGLAVTIEAVDAAGVVTPLATFDQTTRPAVALLGPEERYWVNIPAATYVTDPSKTYRIRARLDGAELGTSVLSTHVFTVLAHNPALPIGVHLRVEGAAVRTVSRQRSSGTRGTPLHCSDGVRNKDETGVDCGGSCRACCIPSPEVCDGIDNDCDGVIDDGDPGGGAACSTGLPGACGAGAMTCTGGHLVCTQTVFPTTETCDRVDNDCDGQVDEGVCPASYQSCPGWGGTPCFDGWQPAQACERSRINRNIIIASHNNPITAVTSALSNGQCYGVGPNYPSPVLFGGWSYVLYCPNGGRLSGTNCYL